MDDYHIIIEPSRTLLIDGNPDERAATARELVHALRESENRCRNRFENMPVGLCRLAPDGSLLEANAALADLLGAASAQSLVGHKLPDFFATAETRRRWRTLLQSGSELNDGECQCRRLDGSMVWLRLRVSAVRDESGSHQHYEGMAEDVTARRQARDTLLREKHFSDTVINSLPGIFYLFDADGTMLRWNRTLERATGYSSEKIAKIHPLEFVAQKEAAEICIKECFAKGQSEFEADLVTHDGARVPYFFTGRLIAHGERPCLAGVGLDISARKRAESENQLLQTVLQAVSTSTDLRGALTAVLQHVCMNTSWSIGEAWLPSADGAYLEAGPCWHGPERSVEEFVTQASQYRFTPGEGLPGRIWQSRQALWVTDVTHDDQFLRLKEAAAAGLRAAMGIPVLTDRDEVAAVLVLFMRELRPEDHRLLGLIHAAVLQIGPLIQRWRAEDDLRRNEARLRALIEAEPECVQVLDADGVVSQMNATGLAMFEADDPSRVIGQPFLPLILPEYQAAYLAFHESVVRGNRGSLEFEICTLQGAHRWIETHAVPITDNDAKVLTLAITRDITARKRNEERLQYLAHYDALTNLPNRALFNDRLAQAMIDARRHDRLVGVVFLDLDRFKMINDSLGHVAGDELLKVVAERLSGSVRAGDTVARQSGDEFTMVLADIGQTEDVARLAQKILATFSQPFRVNEREIFVSASLGITIYPLDHQEIHGLLRNADAAMYRAKETGKNSYQFYTPEMTVKAKEALALEHDLRRAIERHEFALAFQPIVGAQDGVIIGIEALLRWNHPERGAISPIDFIPLAEETGLIVAIGEWALETACTQARDWLRLSKTPLRLAVNLSARQFQQPDLMANLSSILRRTDFPPASLEIEITESLLMEHGENTVGILDQMSALGISIAIDDFGTGYSSLSYLKRFPIDAVKIDQSFVRDIPGDPDDAAIAQAIITMAHSLGMRVIAEGVETSEQLDFLRSHGCDALQGYFFSRPLAPDAIELLLRS